MENAWINFKDAYIEIPCTSEQRVANIKESERKKLESDTLYEQTVLNLITSEERKLSKYLKRYPKPRQNPILQIAKIDQVIKSIKFNYKSILDHLKYNNNYPQYASYPEYDNKVIIIKAKVILTYLQYLVKLKHEFNRFIINLEELCQEAFKPSRVMYQLSIDPEYNEY